jgi:hypothetical protein
MIFTPALNFSTRIDMEIAVLAISENNIKNISSINVELPLLVHLTIMYYTKHPGTAPSMVMMHKERAYQRGNF